MKDYFESFYELTNHNKTELSVKKKQEVEYVLEGSLKPQRGQFIWEVNELTGEIKKAEFKRKVAAFSAKLPPEELVMKSGCIYIPALNEKNAMKKYLKEKRQSEYYAKPPLLTLHTTKKKIWG